MRPLPLAFEVLTEGDIARIEEATETLLEKTGFRVSHPDLRAKAKAAGARVDDASERVRLPKELLRELLTQAPTSFHVSWQDGTHVTYGEGEAPCLAIVTDPWIIDYEQQRPRRPVLEDLRMHTVIAQKMDCVAAISRDRIRVCGPSRSIFSTSPSIPVSCPLPPRAFNSGWRSARYWPTAGTCAEAA